MCIAASARRYYYAQQPQPEDTMHSSQRVLRYAQQARNVQTPCEHSKSSCLLCTCICGQCRGHIRIHVRRSAPRSLEAQGAPGYVGFSPAPVYQLWDTSRWTRIWIHAGFIRVRAMLIRVPVDGQSFKSQDDSDPSQRLDVPLFLLTVLAASTHSKAGKVTQITQISAKHRRIRIQASSSLPYRPRIHNSTHNSTSTRFRWWWSLSQRIDTRPTGMRM